jgi:hypothetical protein
MADSEHKVTFVCCIEAGGLEEQTVRMVDSLRRWGGALADAPVVAVSPRLNVPVSRRARVALERLNVRYLRGRTNKRHDWFKFLNKPYALAAAADGLQTPQVAWLDSDVFILKEPSALVLADDEDFSACASDRNIGTIGDDVNAPYFVEISKLFGLGLRDLPMVTAIRDEIRIHFYFNSGIFSYRAATGFADRYLEGCVRVLESGVASRSAGVFFTDQVALGMVALSMGLRWRELPLSHNYAVNANDDHAFDPAALRDAAICHYHDCGWEPQYAKFLARLTEASPAAGEWLRADGPLVNRIPMPWKAANLALREWRERRMKRWAQRCRAV